MRTTNQEKSAGDISARLSASPPVIARASYKRVGNRLARGDADPRHLPQKLADAMNQRLSREQILNIIGDHLQTALGGILRSTPNVRRQRDGAISFCSVRVIRSTVANLLPLVRMRKVMLTPHIGGASFPQRQHGRVGLAVALMFSDEIGSERVAIY